MGPAGITATRRGLQKLRGNLAEIVRLAELANLYDAPIAPATWEFIRRQAPQLSGEPSPEACRWFLVAAVASRPAGRAAPRPARRRHPGTLHPRFRPRPRTAAIQPVSQVHGGRALSAGGGVRRANWPATRGRWDASTAASPTSACCTWRC